ncbi:E3 ubiquitin-protein ligase RNF185-like isoform X2 [Gigantopelta aegis]|uniref:E3 ubiquitin-protein ligase RNF185-like isoform X2 n=1 Tax=Gigantopelta aegis TaxID=1735272 RepID=UPI001B88D7FD|nr:E3 ubiquitin-protein ligase RNF185-like isoform X2 [Gigantopelta aegis]
MSAAVCSICEDSSCGLATCIPCGHVFGKKCISQWMRTSYNNGCPTCRERIQKVQRIFLDNDSIGYQDYKENTPKTDRGKIVQLKEKTGTTMASGSQSRNLRTNSPDIKGTAMGQRWSVYKSYMNFVDGAR